MAQTALGIKGGLNLSGVRTDYQLVLENKSKPGWQAGFFSKSLNEGWGYWAEAYINALGSTQEFGDELQKNSIGHLSVPLAMQYSLPTGISLYLGGYASMRLWASRKSTKLGVGDFESNIKENIAFMDYGPWAGVSFSYGKFSFDLRYLYGIANINTNSQLNIRANNLSGQLSIGYFLKRVNQR